MVEAWILDHSELDKLLQESILNAYLCSALEAECWALLDKILL